MQRGRTTTTTKKREGIIIGNTNAAYSLMSIRKHRPQICVTREFFFSRYYRFVDTEVRMRDHLCVNAARKKNYYDKATAAINQH